MEKNCGNCKFSKGSKVLYHTLECFKLTDLLSLRDLAEGDNLPVPTADFSCSLWEGKEPAPEPTTTETVVSVWKITTDNGLDGYYIKEPGSLVKLCTVNVKEETEAEKKPKGPAHPVFARIEDGKFVGFICAGEEYGSERMLCTGECGGDKQAVVTMSNASNECIAKSCDTCKEYGDSSPASETACYTCSPRNNWQPKPNRTTTSTVKKVEEEKGCGTCVHDDKKYNESPCCSCNAGEESEERDFLWTPKGGE